ncbi:exosortase B [Roseateles sp. GG27B]
MNKLAASPSVPFDFRAWIPLALLVLGWAVMYGPSYVGLSQTIWASDEQGHGPIILGVSIWLLFQKRVEFASLAREPLVLLPSLLMLVGILAYSLGRSQHIWTLEIGSQILVLSAVILFFFGYPGLKLAWFPLLFLIFMIPWPGDLVSAVTSPLKSAVSVVASDLLYRLGYPVGRSGVILTVGPYQLLVADACAGLNSMFTLEALGLLYMNIMKYTSAARNITLAILIIPISFVANVVRVMILVLVTYHFGDEAGQGFVHSFAGMVLFLVALTLILAVDNFLGFFFSRGRNAK